MAKPSTKGAPPRVVSREAMRRARPLEFLREVVAELKKVVWPTREETSRLTFIVLLVSIAVGIVLGIIDLGFTEVFSRFIFRGP